MIAQQKTKIYMTQSSSRAGSKKAKSTRTLLAKSRLFVETFIALLILVSPFVYYLYEYAPREDSWSVLFFDFGSNGYKNVYISFWVYMSKIVPLYLLLIWFLTCKHWWYHIILIPLAMYSFQLFNALTKHNTRLDELEIYWMIPIMLIIAPFVYWIRLRLVEKHVLGIDLKKIDKELEEYKAKEREDA